MDEILEGWDKDLYDKLSFEYLIACGENERIDEWNALYLEYLESEWKRLYPERMWDPENVFELVKRQSGFKKPDFSKKDFREAISRGVSFTEAHLEGADFIFSRLKGADFWKAHLERANFIFAHLKKADFREAHLEGVKFQNAHLEEANFWKAHLERAEFEEADLDETFFSEAHLEGADFWLADLDGSDFSEAHLEGVKFQNAHLEGADFNGAHLEEADFTYAVVDGGTLFSQNSIDDKTDFTGTALSATRIDPNLRTKLERNIRKIHWEEWYDKAKVSPVRCLKKLTGKKQTSEEKQECPPSLIDRLFINPFVRLFWCLTDYGSSTKRVVIVFFVWNILWAFIYQFLLPLQPGPILAGTNTMVLDTPNIITAVMQTNLMVFSITDVATRNLDYPALIFVTVQIVVGYFILAALITRLGIMFQNLSP